MTNLKKYFWQSSTVRVVSAVLFIIIVMQLDFFNNTGAGDIILIVYLLVCFYTLFVPMILGQKINSTPPPQDLINYGLSLALGKVRGCCGGGVSSKEYIDIGGATSLYVFGKYISAGDLKKIKSIEISGLIFMKNAEATILFRNNLHKVLQLKIQAELMNVPAAAVATIEGQFILSRFDYAAPDTFRIVLKGLYDFNMRGFDFV